MSPGSATVPHGLVGLSPQICQIRNLINKLGRSRSPVLLLGESGVGKEVVARAIHDANPSGNFVPIDCGSLVGPLMESELFGHTKGAFTGAAEAKRGLIELANGGTAFFDEIGDLPLEMQVKLLRMLQEREYRPVGSLIRHKVELRVIAATHRDLGLEVSQGRFRQDLFYRLNVIAVQLPPLRDRKGDVPVLIDHFLAQLGNRHAMTGEVRSILCGYDWPGNVRELWNCIQRMTALNSGPLLHLADLPESIHNPPRKPVVMGMAASAGNGLGRPAMYNGSGEYATLDLQPPPTIVPLKELERRAILEALRFTGGDRTETARLLGIGRTTLYRKLQEYDLGA